MTSTLPQAIPEHPAPDTDQLTTLAAFAGATVTENWYGFLFVQGLTRDALLDIQRRAIVL